MRSFRLVSSVALVAVLLVACGDDRTDSIDATSTTGTTDATSTGVTVSASDSVTAITEPSGSVPLATDAPANPDKPTVSLPAELPTELVVTDLVTGEGPEAKAGDLLVMNYVGVRSEDGTEFDNSYDRGQTLNLTLGAGGVIPGWDQGLVGVQQGGRRQLDIPAELAYGDNPQGDIIQPGDALSFVVDAVAVISAPDPADKPEFDVKGGDNVTSLAIDDLVVGEGDELAEGQTAVVYLTAFRNDTGELLLSSWDNGTLEEIPNIVDGSLPGIYQGMQGLKIGGRRQITIPFADAFGPDGSPDLGLPASTDLVIIIELFGAY